MLEASHLHKRYKQQPNGFTLIEVLLVLSIFLIIVSVSVGAIFKNTEKREFENFLQQLSKDFHYAQAFAISHGSNVYFVMDQARREYRIQYDLRNILVKPIPSQISFQQGVLDAKLTITSLGHVGSFGSWRFASENYKYAFMVLIGRGRHYYYEF